MTTLVVFGYLVFFLSGGNQTFTLRTFTDLPSCQQSWAKARTEIPLTGVSAGCVDLSEWQLNAYVPVVNP